MSKRPSSPPVDGGDAKKRREESDADVIAVAGAPQPSSSASSAPTPASLAALGFAGVPGFSSMTAEQKAILAGLVSPLSAESNAESAAPRAAVDSALLTSCFAMAENDEQRAAWELLQSTRGGAAGGDPNPSSTIPPSFRRTFLWRLKPTRACTQDEWTADKSTIVEDETSDEGHRSEEDEGEDDDDDDEAASSGSPPVSGVAPPPFVSKHGGLPYLPSADSWPTCGLKSCKSAPLHFFFQLLLSDMPAGLGSVFRLPDVPADKQLLQFFLHPVQACPTGFEAHSRSHCVRIVDLTAYDAATHVSEATKHDAASNPLAPERLLVGWRARTDYPHELAYKSYDGLQDAFDNLHDRDDAYDLLDAIDARYTPLLAEKVSGFPCIDDSMRDQMVTYLCPDCSSPMRFVLQTSGDWQGEQEGIQFDQGCGFGHISQCTTHPERLAFAFV